MAVRLTSLLFHVAGNNEHLCGPLEVLCVKNATGNFVATNQTKQFYYVTIYTLHFLLPFLASFHEEGYDSKCRNPVCYSPCTEVKYDSDVSYLPYQKNNYFPFHHQNS